MPIYEYHCGGCRKEFELLVSNSAVEVLCPDCQNGDVKRLFSPFAVTGKSRKATSSSACGDCTSSSCSTCQR